MYNLFCKTITVFLKTSKYEKKIYSNSKTYNLIEPTIDLRIIWKISDQLLKDIFKDSFLYSKVGIILSDFYNEEFIQKSLIDDECENKILKKNQLKIMKLIENINNRYGYGKIKLSSDCNEDFFSNKKQKNENLTWQMKSEYRSPCYTTRWYDIPKVKGN